MKSIDVQFNAGDEFATGRNADRWSSRKYAYYVTDEQARRIEADKLEFAVVRAPTDAGGLKVVKIVGQPSDTPEKATRRIVDVVDFADYEKAERNLAEARRIRKEIDRLAKEAAERARIEALAAGSPEIRELMDRLEALGV
jgi:hypothetical protein